MVRVASAYATKEYSQLIAVLPNIIQADYVSVLQELHYCYLAL